MRRAIFFVGVAGAAFAVLGQLDPLPAALAAGLTVVSSIALAAIAHGGATFATEAVAMGAGGALAYEAARPYVPLVASGLLLSFVFATRALRARTWRELALHLAMAFGSGAAASWIARAHDRADVTLWLIAVVVAALLASVPWLVPAEGPRSFTLRRLAANAPGSARWTLLRAAVLARRYAEITPPLAPRVRHRINRAFEEVVALGEARMLGRGGSELERTVDHLQRIVRAATRRALLLESLDADPESLRGEHEALEAEVAALRDLR